MSLPENPIVVIPARLAATRLPDKPLADINGEPMIVHVWRRAMEAEIGPVIVAAAEQVVADAVRAAGGEAVLTDPDLPSGSDRIHSALEEADPGGRHDAVINLQGDLPTIDPASVRAALSAAGRRRGRYRDPGRRHHPRRGTGQPQCRQGRGRAG